VRECKVEQNKASCACTYQSCSRKGICCECISYHWNHRELPACLFPPEVERTYDRSLERFLSIHNER
jgi:hypothetical protein